MRYLATVIIVLVAGGLWPTAAQPGPEPQQPTFRAGVDLVTVTVVVQDRQGRPVAGLTQSDFELFDAGQPCGIVDFRSDPAPVSVAVLVDVSGSMDVAAKMADARSAVRHVLSWLNAGSDQVALFAFDTRLQELQGFTKSPSDVGARLDALRPFGATSLYDAIAQTGRRLVAQGGARRAVVVVTDGVDTSSRLTPSQVSGIASAIDVPVYVLAVVSPLDRSDDAGTPGHMAATDVDGPLSDLARWTGGHMFVASAPAHASVAARQIVTELREQYLIAFEPSQQAGWHPLDVRTRHKNLIVRARSGYVAGTRLNSQQ